VFIWTIGGFVAVGCGLGWYLEWFYATIVFGGIWWLGFCKGKCDCGVLFYKLGGSYGDHLWWPISLGTRGSSKEYVKLHLRPDHRSVLLKAEVVPG